VAQSSMPLQMFASEQSASTPQRFFGETHDLKIDTPWLRGLQTAPA